MLALWPIISVVLVSRRDPGKALALIVVGGFLLLPMRTAFDAPFVPPLDKNFIITLSAFLALGLRRPPGFTWLPKRRLFRVLYAGYATSPILTVLANGDNLIDGAAFLPGLALYDILGIVFDRATELILFSLGLNYLETQKAQISFLKWLVILGLAWSVLVLFEIRLSPQLHTWVYGFSPQGFVQQMRQEGFRSTVFLGHGLNVSFFIFTCLAASAALWRTQVRILPIQTSVIVLYFLALLLLNKSLGSLIYGVFFLVAIAALKPKWKMRMAALATVLMLIYPALRSTDLIPTDGLVRWSSSISADRAASLQFRFDNEDILLEKANQRPLLGWGSWGRNRVYSPETGEDITITDGSLIIRLGAFGWIGFITQFGLLFGALSLPEFWRMSVAGPSAKDLQFISTLAVYHLVVFIDQIINSSSVTPILYLTAPIFFLAIKRQPN